MSTTVVSTKQARDNFSDLLGRVYYRDEVITITHNFPPIWQKKTLPQPSKTCVKQGMNEAKQPRAVINTNLIVSGLISPRSFSAQIFTADEQDRRRFFLVRMLYFSGDAAHWSKTR
jgi:hypothetical protein